MNEWEEQEYTKKFDAHLWKRLLSRLWAEKKLMGWLVLSFFMLAAQELIEPLLVSYAIDHFVVPKTLENFGWYVLVYLIAFLVKGVGLHIWIRTCGYLESNIVFNLRRDAFQRLQELSFSYYDRTPVGWINARVISDADRLGYSLAWGLGDIIWGLAMLPAMAVLLLVLNWKMALITMLVVPPTMLVAFYFRKKILTAHRDVRKTNSRITAGFAEGISGAKTTKTLVREQQNMAEFGVHTSKMRQVSIHAAVINALFMPLITILGACGSALALYYGGNGVLMGVVTYGMLTAFMNYATRFFQPIQDLARRFAELQAAQAAGERILGLVETQPDIVDEGWSADWSADSSADSSANLSTDGLSAMQGHISFQHVTFQYAGGEKVLEDFNLDIPAGQTVALVGETGSGKSTIVNLACRFYEPTEGAVLIDGVDYRSRPQAWLHSNLGYVLQAPHLFSGTVMENIRYGRLTATDAEVVEAARLVDAHSFIEKLHKGYETPVGEGGNLLSTGQKQLISFARAVLADPRIFVLDEATSSIDTETEQIIQKAIREVLTGRTSFIIAHRLSTIKSADRILVIREGHITEQGTHRELLRAKGYYYRLYTQQFREQLEETLWQSST